MFLYSQLLGTHMLIGLLSLDANRMEILGGKKSLIVWRSNPCLKHISHLHHSGPQNFQVPMLCSMPI
jgi:hypothetical protein